MKTPAAMYGLLGVLILIWGTTWSVIRIGLEGVPPLTGVALRFALAGFLLWLAGRLTGVQRQSSANLRRLWVVECLFGFMISYGVVYWAEQWVPSGLTSVLFSTFPFFVAVIAHFWLDDEPLRPRAAIGLLLGIGGVSVIFSEDLTALAGPGVAQAALVVMCAPIAGAVSHVAIKKWGRGYHPINIAAVPMLATGVLMGVLAGLLESGEPIELAGRALGALVYLSLVGTVVTFTLYYWLLARLPATRVSLITYVIPLVALGIGVGVLGEPWSARMLVGSGLVLLGVSLAS